MFIICLDSVDLDGTIGPSWLLLL